MLRTKRKSETVLRNVVAAISAALRPSAVIGRPMCGAMLLPSCVPLPTASLLPSALLLPTARLFLGALWDGVASLPLWLLSGPRFPLWLLGSLLRLLGGPGLPLWLLGSLLRLLCGPGLPLRLLGSLLRLLCGPGLPLWLLGSLLRLLCGPGLPLWLLGSLLRLLCGLGLPLWLLGVLLLLGWLGLLLFLFLAVLPLSIDRSIGSQKQKQNCYNSSDRYHTFHIGTPFPVTSLVPLNFSPAMPLPPMTLWFSTRSKWHGPV